MQGLEGGFTACFSSDDRTSGSSNDFTIRLSPGMDLSSSDRWAIYMADLSLWYTWYNISTLYGTTTFKYSHNAGVNWNTIELTPGIYKADDLITAIGLKITANGHTSASILISANQNTQKFVFSFVGGYQVDFTGLNIRTIFGAESAIYSVSGAMPNVAKMTYGVNSWYLNCDLLDTGYQGRTQGRVLHSFVPDVSPGSAIRETPQATYSLVRSTRVVNEIRFWLTDQLGRSLSIQDEPISLRLHFKPLSA